jgi:hypothetical protein
MSCQFGPKILAIAVGPKAEVSDVRFGSKADICDAGAMSALRPKADRGPQADIRGNDLRETERPPRGGLSEIQLICAVVGNRQTIPIIET